MHISIFSWMSGAIAFAIFNSSFAFTGWWSATVLFLWLGCTWFSWRWVRLRWLCMFILGALYAAWRFEQTLALQLPVDQSNRLFKIEGTLLSVAGDSSGGSTSKLYTFKTISAVDYADKPFKFGKLNLRIYAGLSPKAGQRCSFYARLKAPVGKRNPGGRNLERAYFQKQISALGYVVAHPINECEEARELGFFSVLRQKLITSLDGLHLNKESAAIIKALVVAEREDISDMQWDVFRETGTSHLVAISGLHITLSAGLFFIVVRTALLLILAGRHSGLITDISLVASVVGAFLYVALANFTLPAERALVLVSISVLGLLFRKPPVSFLGLSWAAFILLLVNPASAMSVGFWLSFGAVLILIMMRHTRTSEHWLFSALRTHCFLSIGLLPITALLTDTVPLASPLGNLLAVPIVSLLVIPLVLLGAICASFDIAIFGALWRTAASIWEPVWWTLTEFAAWTPDIYLAFQPHIFQLGLAMLAVLLMLVPVFPSRWLFIAACVLQLMFNRSEAIKAEEFRVVVLDVGQGLATIVQTANHVLVYDTGPSFGGYSAGTAVVLPALKAYGISTIDRLLISHGDNDHAGGYVQLRRKLKIKDTMISPVQAGIENATLCELGQSWSWDGVTFDILSPTRGISGTENDLSCVLRVFSTHGSVLLPGDIERRAERILLDNHSIVLKSDVVLAPHHGSRTSSTAAFVQRVGPKYVVFTAGFFNRFSFPHVEVVSRYLKTGADPMISSEFGAIEFLVGGEEIRVKHARDRRLEWKSYQLNGDNHAN